MNIFVACAIATMVHLEVTPWSKVDNGIFQQVFELYTVAFLGSILACYTAQTVDIIFT